MTDIYFELFERKSLNVNKTGKQTCLVDIVKESSVNVLQMEVDEAKLGTDELSILLIVPHLYQAGCLTIKRFEQGVVEFSHEIYIAEAKSNKSVERVPAQIRERSFVVSASGRRVTFLGINFSLGFCQTHGILAEVADFK